MGLCIDLKDQTHQWHNTVQAALSRAVPFLPRKMRYQGQPLETNRSHSLLEEMKRNALQQTELCKHLPPAQNIRLCCLVLQAEHGYLPLGKAQLPCLLGEKSVLWHRSKISEAFHSACLSHEFCWLQSHWLNVVFHFPPKSWQQPTCFGVHLCEWGCGRQTVRVPVLWHQAAFRCCRRHNPRNSPRQHSNAMPLTKPRHKHPAGNMIMPWGKEDW